jgi:hypothetical protein
MPLRETGLPTTNTASQTVLRAEAQKKTHTEQSLAFYLPVSSLEVTLSLSCSPQANIGMLIVDRSRLDDSIAQLS